MDEDLHALSRDDLIAEVKQLRAGIGRIATAPGMSCAGIIRNCGG